MYGLYFVEGDGYGEIDYDFCKGCGICQKICKHGAITMESEK